MAISNSIITMGLSGRVGNLVFSQRNGKTVVSKMPKKSKKSTAKQRSIRDRFRQGAAYARVASTTPELAAIYKNHLSKKLTVFTRAFKDFWTSPKIQAVDIAAYDGSVGSLISIRAMDNFRVSEVEVSIISPTGELIDQGLAERSLYNDQWCFHTIAAVNPSRCIIQVKARDMAGNETVQKVKVPRRKQKSQP